ncbi:ARM repeat-containing protein [Coniophora puteana RWD-64-598 SS2]|uniref:Nucleolar protein 9 n=1 Tax=Coniophora puteana (strain RWD-64-598) TaxID=741705 RepID=A0A5M3MTG3_CONPW|nr:ARM repeat-containing protein [Coniophora puteana RWD-64-598 SS2]EIW82459.1 ARM repeat-containing protein [Coniophora puteana RWD-64-598 SS2]
MPQENRKRGKKHKKSEKQQEETFSSFQEPAPEQNESWIIPAAKPDADLEAPFGYVDADIKAYFRNVDEQLRNWQQDGTSVDQGDEVDPNEERRIFFLAALSEMSGNEKQLATDPDCSVILERMIHSMDDFVRRVFIDSLTGSFNILLKHRFASHVCQTLFTTANATVSRESRGFIATQTNADKGELRTLTRLLLDICEEIRPDLPALIMDSFASHALRAMLLLLAPTIPLCTENSAIMRSKKSSVWKAKQGAMKPLFGIDSDSTAARRAAPQEHLVAARSLVDTLRNQMDANEVRSLAANTVASPTLQIFLEIEAQVGNTIDNDSLLDRVLFGLVSHANKDPDAPLEASDYVVTLFRDTTASHLLEVAMRCCKGTQFDLFWSTYLKGKFSRLSVHPVANFAIARALGMSNSDQLLEALSELQGSWSKMLKDGRIGVLKAAVERSAVSEMALKETIKVKTCKLLYESILTPDRQCAQLFNSPKPWKIRSALSLAYSKPSESTDTHSDASKSEHKRRHGLESNVQGALLLQSMLRLPHPHNALPIESIRSLPIEGLLHLAHNPTSSRVLDVFLEAASVPFPAKRGLVMSFIGHYHMLVDDRIGSRVGDRCWNFADPYLKEKIARSLIPQEQFLTASYYGKFFARNLNLYLLQKRPQEWKDAQARKKTTLSATHSAKIGESKVEEAAAPSNAVDAPITPERKTKRKRTDVEDEISAVFDTALGKKVKKGSAKSISPSTRILDATPNDLDGIMDAIKRAPSTEKSTHGKKQKS